MYLTDSMKKEPWKFNNQLSLAYVRQFQHIDFYPVVAKIFFVAYSCQQKFFECIITKCWQFYFIYMYCFINMAIKLLREKYTGLKNRF